MTAPLYTSIARTLDAYIRVIGSDDAAANKHRATLDDLQSWLPANDGINSGCEIDTDAAAAASTPSPGGEFWISVPFQTASGWCTFTVIVHASMIGGIHLVCECDDDGYRGDDLDIAETSQHIADRVRAALHTRIKPAT